MKKRDKAGNRLSSLAVNLLVLLIFSVAMFIVAEVFTRIVFPQPVGLYVYDEVIGFKLLPNFSGWHRGPAFKVPIKTNELGMRWKPLEERTADKTRILGLGDSNLYGWGLLPENSLLGYFENKLAGDYPDYNFEVVNAAVPAYCTFNQMKYLEENIDILQPDIVMLFFTPDNDFSDNEIFANDLYEFPDTTQMIIRLSKKSMLINNAYNLYQRFFPDNKPGRGAMHVTNRVSSYKTYFDERLKLAADIISRMHQITLDRKADFFLVLPPDRQWVLFPNEMTRRMATEVDSVFNALAVENNFNYLYLGEQFYSHPNPEELYLPSDMHWSQAGHSFIGKILVENFKSRGLVNN